MTKRLPLTRRNAAFTGLHLPLGACTRDFFLNDSTGDPEVYIRIGPPGTGKSRWLDEQYGLDKWIEAPDNTGKWFDGCELSDILVFNDVCCGAVPPLDIFKKLTDRYHFRGAIKGGFTWLKPKVIHLHSHPR